MRSSLLSLSAVLVLGALFLLVDAAHDVSPQHGRRDHVRAAARRAQQSAVAARATHAPFQRRLSGSGRATFYDPSTGPGNCGKTFQKSDPIVAVNSAQFSMSDCYKWITVTANGKTVSAQITDSCPSCSYGQLDFSPAVFDQFASPSAGIFSMSWSLGGSSSSNNNDDDDDDDSQSSTSSSYKPKPKPTTSSTSSTPAYTPTSTSSSSTYSKPTSTSSSSSSSSSASSSTASSSSASSSSAAVVTPTANNLAGLAQAVNGFYAMAGQADQGSDDAK